MDMEKLLPIGGGIIQGALGFIKAKKAQSEAKRQAKINNAMAQNDTQFGAFNASLNGGRQVGAVSDQGPSALGGALSGGLSGVMQGQNIYQGMQESKMNDLMLKKLANGGQDPMAAVGAPRNLIQTRSPKNIYDQMLPE